MWIEVSGGLVYVNCVVGDDESGYEKDRSKWMPGIC